MLPGTKEDAIVLARQRWSQLHPFDLSAETWEQLFEDHHPGDVLEAIGKTKFTRDSRPAQVYESLLYWFGRMKKQRAEANATWEDFAGICTRK